MNSEASKRNHFIPQFYQRGFIHGSQGLIWVYEKGREPERRPLRKTAMEIDLYGFTNLQGEFDSQTIESALSIIESNAALVIRRLGKGDSLTDLERSHLAKFISVMLRRTTKHKENVKKMGEEMMPKFFEEHDEEWLYQVIKKRIDSPDEAERIFEGKKEELQKVREKYLREVPDWLFPTNVLRDSLFEQVLLMMDWAYFRSSSNIEFLTSDNPVVFSKGTGLKDREAVIMCPITKTLFFEAMWISSYRSSFVDLPDAKVKLLNRYIVQNAQKRVYTSYRSRTLASFVNKWIGTFENPLSTSHSG